MTPTMGCAQVMGSNVFPDSKYLRISSSLDGWVWLKMPGYMNNPTWSNLRNANWISTAPVGQALVQLWAKDIAGVAGRGSGSGIAPIRWPIRPSWEDAHQLERNNLGNGWTTNQLPVRCMVLGCSLLGWGLLVLNGSGCATRLLQKQIPPNEHCIRRN